jgi:hypothetical protein
VLEWPLYDPLSKLFSKTLCLHIYPKWFLLLKIENYQKYRPFLYFRHEIKFQV